MFVVLRRTVPDGEILLRERAYGRRQTASSMLQELIRQGASVHAKPLENARLERRSGAGLLKNGAQVFLQCLKDHRHLPHRWLVAVPDEGTEQLAEHAGRSAPVRVDVCSVQVT